MTLCFKHFVSQSSLSVNDLSKYLINKVAFFLSKPTSYNDGLSWYREDASRKGRYSLY